MKSFFLACLAVLMLVSGCTYQAPAPAPPLDQWHDIFHSSEISVATEEWPVEFLTGPIQPAQPVASVRTLGIKRLLTPWEFEIFSAPALTSPSALDRFSQSAIAVAEAQKGNLASAVSQSLKQPLKLVIRPDGPASITSEAIISRAQQYLGVPYLWGGTTGSGLDCSAYVSLAWGISRQTTDTLYRVSFPIAKEELLPGDVLNLTTGQDPRRYGHVRLFSGWANSNRTMMWVYEETWPRSVYHVIPYDARYTPMRRINFSPGDVLPSSETLPTSFAQVITRSFDSGPLVPIKFNIPFEKPSVIPPSQNPPRNSVEIIPSAARPDREPAPAPVPSPFQPGPSPTTAPLPKSSPTTAASDPQSRPVFVPTPKPASNPLPALPPALTPATKPVATPAPSGMPKVTPSPVEKTIPFVLRESGKPAGERESSALGQESRDKAPAPKADGRPEQGLLPQKPEVKPDAPGSKAERGTEIRPQPQKPETKPENRQETQNPRPDSGSIKSENRDRGKGR